MCKQWNGCHTPLFYECYQVYFCADHDETNDEWQNLVTRLPTAWKRVSQNGQLEIAICRARWVE